MATLALFVALGGGAYAASQINGAKLRNHSVAGGKLKPNTLTGAQIRESKLGKVPKAKRADNSAALGGTAASGFIKGSGQSLSARGSVSPNDIQNTVLDLPGFGNLAMVCNAAGSAVAVQFINGSGATEMASVSNLLGGNNSNVSLADGNTVALSVSSTPTGALTVLVHAGVNGSTPQVADVVVAINTPGSSQPCSYQAHALLAG